MAHQTEHPSTVERIAEVLRTRIIRGDIAGGAALRQDHVAEEFRSSHVPVREAFRQLEAQGLVLTLPRRGVRVTQVDRAAVKENAEMRGALEILALRHSVRKFGPQHIARLEEAQDACAQAASNRVTCDPRTQWCESITAAAADSSASRRATPS